MLEQRQAAKTFRDLGYGSTAELMELLNEVARLLKGCPQAILDSGF